MTATITKAECDHCGHRVRIREDGTIGLHRYTRRGQKVECEHSGKRYSFHMGTFRVVERGPDAVATLWLCECRCGETKAEPTYQELEAWHDGHVTDAYRSGVTASPTANLPEGHTYA